MNSRITWLVILAFLFTAPTAFAAYWDPLGNDLSWCNGQNWSMFLSGIPSSTDYVIVDATDEGPVQIGPGCYAVASGMTVGQFENTAVIKLNPGGLLHVYGDITLGNYHGTGIIYMSDSLIIDGLVEIGYGYWEGDRGIGQLFINGGGLDAKGGLTMGDQGGDGTLIINSGWADIIGTLEMVNGTIIMNNGIMYTDDLSGVYPPYSTFDIRNEAAVIIWKDLVNHYGHSKDVITACNGNGTTDITYYSNATIITTKCKCPEADLTNDCAVDLNDLALMANQWLSGK